MNPADGARREFRRELRSDDALLDRVVTRKLDEVILDLMSLGVGADRGLDAVRRVARGGMGWAPEGE